MKQALLGAIRQFSELKIVVLGDVMLDIYDFCRTEHSRPSPEAAGKRVYTAARSIKALGGAGNVAANLAALDASTVLITVCGEDGHRMTLESLAAEGRIHPFFIADARRPTTTKTRLYIDNQYALRRDDETTDELPPELAEAVLREFRREVKGADAVVLSDYAKGFFTESLAQTLIRECQARHVPVIVDFKPKNRAFFRGADLIAPNRGEAESLVAGFTDEATLEEAVKKLFGLLACRSVAVTLGADGVCAYDGKTFFRLAGNKVEAADSVGCGDTVRAGMALGRAAGLGLKELLGLANDAAAVVVQKIGTATVGRTELAEFIQKAGGA